MYLWKYWRESRIIFVWSMVLIAMLFVAVLRARVTMGGASQEDFRQTVGMIIFFFYLQVVPLGFLAWLLGSLGVGRDLGENSGSFLLTRPRRRAWFLWRDWGFGMTQVALATIFLSAVIWLIVHRALVAAGDPFNGRIPMPGMTEPVLVTTLCGIICAGGLVIAGLIFSVTYFSTILIQNSRGTLLSAGLFVGYLALGAVLHHYWQQVQFPSLLLQLFKQSGPGINNHLPLEIAVRAALILLFPIAAQVLLEHSDI
jgi:hypothetical protein